MYVVCCVCVSLLYIRYIDPVKDSNYYMHSEGVHCTEEWPESPKQMMIS